MINTVIEALDTDCQSSEINTLELAVSMLDQVKFPTESNSVPFWFENSLLLTAIGSRLHGKTTVEYRHDWIISLDYSYPWSLVYLIPSIQVLQ